MDRRVQIHEMSWTDMNYKCGVAIDFHPMDPDDCSTWKYTVRLDDGTDLIAGLEHVRTEGLHAIAPLLDKRVQLDDGPRGVAINYVPHPDDPNEFIYEVKLEDSKIFKVEIEQLRLLHRERKPGKEKKGKKGRSKK